MTWCYSKHTKVFLHWAVWASVEWQNPVALNTSKALNWWRNIFPSIRVASELWNVSAFFWHQRNLPVFHCSNYFSVWKTHSAAPTLKKFQALNCLRSFTQWDAIKYFWGRENDLVRKCFLCLHLEIILRQEKEITAKWKLWLFIIKSCQKTVDEPRRKREPNSSSNWSHTWFVWRHFHNSPLFFLHSKHGFETARITYSLAAAYVAEMKKTWLNDLQTLNVDLFLFHKLSSEPTFKSSF